MTTEQEHLKALEARILEALKRVEEQDPNGAVVIFPEAEANALLEVARWWIALRGAGKIGTALASAVKWLALMVGAWLAVKAGILEWILHNIGGAK